MSDSPSLPESPSPSIAGVPRTSPVPEATGEPQSPRLSQLERVVDTYIAPSLTFADIRRNASWWLPWLLSAVVGSLFIFTVSRTIGWEQVARNAIAQGSAAQQEQMSRGTPAQQAAAVRQVAGFIKYTAYFGPVFGLIAAAIVAAVLLGTVNFIFGGRATFPQMFAMVNYAYLPNVLKFLLGLVLLYVSPNPERFNLQNSVATNLAYYLDPATPKWLMSVASSLDVATIWIVVLLVIGCALVARIKRSQAVVAVVGWWVLMIVIGAAWAGLRG